MGSFTAEFIAHQSAMGKTVVTVDASSPGTYNVLPDDDIVNVANVSSSDYTITLPAVGDAIVGKDYEVKDSTGSCNSPKNINIGAAGGVAIDEATTWVFSFAWAGMTVYTDGVKWFRRIR